jgi:dihydrolipoamide dehydrogenase
MSEYDVVIIGAGPAGYVCAIRASQLGLKAAIVDKQWLGGVCLNIGCIPSKALLRNADIAHILRQKGKEFGFSFENLQLDYSAAVKRSRQVSDRLTKGVGFLMKKNKVEVFMAEAKIKNRNTVSLIDSAGKTEELTAKNIVIATGSNPVIPAGWSVDGKSTLTYKEAILQEKLPKSAVIIGSGAIGVEFATIWNSYGVKVTVVEMLPTLVPLEDEEIGTELAKAFKREGIQGLVGTKVEAVESVAEGVKVTVSAGESKQTLEAEQALLAIGVKPNSRGIGLEELGVSLSQRGMVEIDDRMATNIPGVWAIGDVTGKLMLAHVGSAQGII